MRITIFGATGGIGSALLAQALEGGHEVRVLVRQRKKVSPHPLITIEEGDVLDQHAVNSVIDTETTAVLSAFAARRREQPINERGTENIARAMSNCGVDRFIGVSAAAMYSDSYDSFLLRAILKPILRRVFKDEYGDLQKMEHTLRESHLLWSLVVPPRLVDGPYTGRYRTAINHNVQNAFAVRRSHVARCMLAAVEDASTFQRMIYVAD